MNRLYCMILLYDILEKANYLDSRQISYFQGREMERRMNRESTEDFLCVLSRLNCVQLFVTLWTIANTRAS